MRLADIDSNRVTISGKDEARNQEMVGTASHHEHPEVRKETAMVLVISVHIVF